MTIKNATECSTGTITCDDVVQNTEQQSRKKCSKDTNSFPDDSKILAHASEVLKQVEGAGLEQNGRVGGETFFGSALSYAESKKRMDVNSDFIAENNTNFSPSCLCVDY